MPRKAVREARRAARAKEKEEEESRTAIAAAAAAAAATTTTAHAEETISKAKVAAAALSVAASSPYSPSSSQQESATSPQAVQERRPRLFSGNIRYKATQIVIQPGHSYDLPVDIPSAGSLLQWHFQIAELDIAFGIQDNASGEWIVPLNRDNDSTEFFSSGKLTIEHAGSLRFVWDNSYSWINEKRIMYNVEVCDQQAEDSARQHMATEVQQFAQHFFQWRATIAPAWCDGISYVSRENDWDPSAELSPESLAEHRTRLSNFTQELKHLEVQVSDGLLGFEYDVEDKVDLLLLRSAIEKTNWELNVLKLPYRNPDFYVRQTLGALHEQVLRLHLPHGDGDGTEEGKNAADARALRGVTTEQKKQLFRQVSRCTALLETFPQTLYHALTNLREQMVPQFAAVAQQSLNGAPAALDELNAALGDVIATAGADDDNSEGDIERGKLLNDLNSAIKNACSALKDFEAWMSPKTQDLMPGSQSSAMTVGAEGIDYYLNRVAAIPFTIQEISTMLKVEFVRASAAESLEVNKSNALGVPDPEPAQSTKEIIRLACQGSQTLREAVAHSGYNLATIPASMPRYSMREMPRHLAPLQHIGCSTDYSGAFLEKDSEPVVISYTPQHSSVLPFFRLAGSIDPRLLLVQDDCPGFVLQLHRSRTPSLQPRPIRRNFLDWGSSQAVALYLEEQLFHCGLFDDRARSREILLTFMRLRALRAHVSFEIAVGNMSVDAGIDFYASKVPMEKDAAAIDVWRLAAYPGMFFTPQVGKVQILEFVADSRFRSGNPDDSDASPANFSLCKFNDNLIANCNVPIAFQRWASTGLMDQMAAFN